MEKLTAEDDKRNREVRIEAAFGSLYPGLYSLRHSEPDRPMLRYVSVRRASPGWFIIVAVTMLPSFEPRVAFGSGVILWDAFRNVSKAIVKREWRPDKWG